MLKVSPINSNTGAQPFTPLVNFLVDDMLLQTRPRISQALLQISNVQHGPAVDMLLHDAPVFIVNWIQVRTILQPQVCGSEMRCRVFDAVLYAVKIVASFYKV